METIAVYWEERIKVYGITAQYNLTLANITFSRSDLASIASILRHLESQINRFELVTCQDFSDVMRIHLLYEQQHSNWVADSFNGKDVQTTTPVDLIYLHGPHFQDRFGIIDSTLAALRAHGIFTICSGCAGTSMYLVFTEGVGREADRILTENFLIPTSS